MNSPEGTDRVHGVMFLDNDIRQAPDTDNLKMNLKPELKQLLQTTWDYDDAKQLCAVGVAHVRLPEAYKLWFNDVKK